MTASLKLGPAGDQYPAIRENIIDFMERSARQYGDVVAFEAAGRPWVMVNDPLLVHELLTAPFDHVTVGPSLVPGARTMGNSIMMSYGASWRGRRALIQRPLSHRNVQHFGDLIGRRAVERADSWASQTEIDLHPEMRHLVLSIVAEALFSWDVEEAVARIRAVGKAFRADYLELWFGPPQEADEDFQRAMAGYDAVIYAMIRERRARADPGDDILGLLVQARDEDGNELNDEAIRDEANTLLFAGHGTTALALTYALFLLSRSPEHQRSLAESVAQLDRSGPLSADDLERLPLARAVFEEALRLYPVAYFQDRAAAAELQLGEVTIEAGTRILISPWVMHRDARSFPEPLRFLPERFLPENRRSVPKYAFVPFGGGPKICVGNHFALLEGALILATIGGRFELEPMDSYTHLIDPSLLDARGTLGVPAGGLHVRIRPRASAA